MLAGLLPSAPSRLELGFPVPFRRHAATDGAYSAALLIGCLIGVGLAWQVVLSDGARGRIMAHMADLSASLTPFVAPESRPLKSRAAPALGMPERPERPQRYTVAVWRVGTTPSKPSEAPVAAVVAAPTVQPLPERLVLTDETLPVAPMPAEEERSAVELEIVYDINSSFLAPAAIAALKDLVTGLPSGRSYRLELQAAVSDDGVRGAKANEAVRYNRWLAERRLDRVANWLREHAKAELAIVPGFIEHDASRRVILSALQVP